ncbi:HLA class II histocompatibility antigen, DM alpha chain-like [Poecile atricapillus]|uniref:HLA class II histocompatibility antigen, DM alpha chain-like n=1 Tax=Poecile atricapillus TaxID=48891 RepID=UPI002739C060|nr:HLA class II histocompatibility antigen, DM alpha chain-like [Poecile atricapillus]
MGVLVASLAWAVFVAVAVGDPAPSPLPPLLSEVLTCQPDPPSASLAISLDGLGLFWFDFPGSRWNSGIPSLPPWPRELETPQEILPEFQLCQEILGILSRQLRGRLPEARGIPMLSVFPALPPVAGEPNSLLCLVENIFPPSLDIGWSSAGTGDIPGDIPGEIPGDIPGDVPGVSGVNPGVNSRVNPGIFGVNPGVTPGDIPGVTTGPFIPGTDLGFSRLARAPLLPRPGEVLACVVTEHGGNGSVVEYWVAPDTSLDEQLGMALAGAALALGLVLALLGLGLALLAPRSRPGPGIIPTWA